MTKGTRENIINAFFRLASKYPKRTNFSFSEIAEEACISRQTIYKNHFNNPDEIVSSICYEINKKIMEALEICSKNHLNMQPLDNICTYLFPLLFHYRIWLNVLYSTASGAVWRMTLKKQYLSWVNDNLELQLFNIKFPKEMLTDIFVNSILATIETWITQPIPESPDIFTKKFLLMYQTQFQITYKKKRNQ